MENKIVLISVIIPVYNVDSYLERCIKSVCNNTYRNLQVICIDDGSTDNSLRILQEFAEKDDRIEIIEKNNAGVSAARNDGLKAAKGNYIAFVDADDWLHRQYFEYLMKPVQMYKADISVCREKRVDFWCEDEKIGKCSIVHLSGKDVLEPPSVKVNVWAKLYKRTRLINIVFNEKVKFLEDELYNLSVICSHGDVAVYFVDIPLYNYFQRPGSAVHVLNHGEEMYWGIMGFISYIKTGQLSDEGKMIFVEQALRLSFSYRYLMMFKANQEVINDNCKYFFDFLWEELINTSDLEAKKWLVYKVFTTMPFAYRLYRIFTDKTMLSWERAQKTRERIKNRD